MGLITSRCRRKPAPVTKQQWQQTMQRPHTLLSRPRAEGEDPPPSLRSPAQRCIPDHLSVALSFLSSTEFAAAVATCRSWHAAGELPSAWSAHFPLGAPGAAAAACLENTWRWFLQGYSRNLGLSSRSLFSVESQPRWVKMDPVTVQHLRSAVSSSRIWQNACELSLSRWLAMWLYGLDQTVLLDSVRPPRLRAVELPGLWAELTDDAAFAVMAPKIEVMIHRQNETTKAWAAWTHFVPQCTQLRVLSLSLTCRFEPAVLFAPLHLLEHLSLTLVGEDADSSQEAFARELALTTRNLSVDHVLRSVQLSANAHERFFEILTAPPSADNGFAPLPLLSSFIRDVDESPMPEPASMWRLILLPTLTALHCVRLPLGSLHPAQASESELAQARRTLARMQTLAGHIRLQDNELFAATAARLGLTNELFSAEDLDTLRHCSSVRALLVFVPASQLADVVDALEHAALDLEPDMRPASSPSSSSSSSSAFSSAVAISGARSRFQPTTTESSSATASGSAVLSRAPLERICVCADDPASSSQFAPLHRLRSLRQIVFHTPDYANPEEWTEALLVGIAGHPSVESIEIVAGRRTISMEQCEPLRLSERCFRAIIATPTLVRIHIGEDRRFDFDRANEQVKGLSAAECVALRHVCFHFTTGLHQLGYRHSGWSQLRRQRNGRFEWMASGTDGVARPAFSLWSLSPL